MNRIWSFMVQYKYQLIIAAVLIIIAVIAVRYYSETGKIVVNENSVAYKQAGKFYLRDSSGASKEITETEYDTLKSNVKNLKK